MKVISGCFLAVTTPPKKILKDKESTLFDVSTFLLPNFVSLWLEFISVSCK